ncbi:fibrinogen C domain-containing protein 1-like [Styela clava]
MLLRFVASQTNEQCTITCSKKNDKDEVLSQITTNVNVDQIGECHLEMEKLEKRVDNLESSLVPTDLIGWTVFQRRKDGSVNFYRDWNDYLAGFGNSAGEFWLGLKEISRLMKLGKYELRIDLQDFDGNWKYAYYKNFHIGEEKDGFPLTTSGYVGTAGNDFQITNVQFSSKDHDHDQVSDDCAERFKGAWWYGVVESTGGHRFCHLSNLNGQYLRGEHDTFAVGVNWRDFRGYHYSLKYSEMKMRLKEN